MSFLIIMSDEHTRRMSGCYGHPVVQTPNIDRLAKRGVRFDNAYCNHPICVPSRANFLTGRYTHDTGHWDNAHPYIGDDEAASWGHRLANQGHQVTSIGKLHYRYDDDPNGLTDSRVSMNVMNGTGDYFGSMRWRLTRGTAVPMNIANSGAGDTEYIRYDSAVGDESDRWLKEDAPGLEKPWALFSSFVTPHFPFVVPEEYFNLYPPESVELPLKWRQQDWTAHPYWDYVRPLRSGQEENFSEEDVRRTLAAYYGLITFMDAQLGRVLDALDEAGLTDSTRIIYTSDHGEIGGSYGLWGKSCMYEDSAGVPLIAAGPDIPAGEVRQTNVSFVDLFPTVLECVGVALEDEDANLPGISLWDIARGDEIPGRIVFSEYHASGSPTGNFMVKDERYKFVYYGTEYPPELFDLQEDPTELNDLGRDPARAETRARLEAELRKICNPQEVNERAFADQRALIDSHGGEEAVLAEGKKVNWTRPPTSFQDDA